MTIPVYPWHWIEEDLKPECAVKDRNGNHCPEPPKHQIDEGVWLCDKCYKVYQEKEENCDSFSVVKI